MSTSTKSQASAPTRSAKVDDKVSTAETIARFIAEGVSGSGVKGLEGPAKTLLGIIRVRDNSALCKDVAVQIGALTETLKAATDTVRAHVTAQALPTTLVQAKLGSSAELTNRIDQLQRRLGEIDSNAAKLQSQKPILRMVLANRNADILREICDHLRQAREDFMFSGQLAVEIALAEVAAEVKASSARHREAELDMALEKLPSAEASYRASVHARHGHLLAGTREALLKELDDWTAAETDSQKEHPFYILSGGAGTGKSTIAYELASRADKAGRLGASFFFMRGSALLSTTEVFFPTLARQLILNVPALHENAVALIHDHLKHGARQNLDVQAEDLFSGLLSQIPSDHPPIVIIVDAVDECTDSAQDLVCHMLYLMMNAMSHISVPLRVFVTSRPEVHIEDAFQARAFSSAQRFILHEIPRPVIDADIRLYFNSALSELPDGPRNSLTLLYPDAPDDLTDLAAGLFIYATTAMEFLKQYRTAITQGMERLVLAARGEPKTALQRLDELYILVLQKAFPRDLLPHKRDSIRAFLGNVAVLQDHIAPSDLAILTGVSLENDILPILDRLGAVLSFESGNPSAPMRPLHASFGEFLVDATRCTDPEFHVDLAQHHLSVTSSCLALLMRPGTLVHNICRLPDPRVPRNEIDDLSARLAEYLPAPVQYSCKHWFVHLALSGGDQGITPALLDFCRHRLLEWIEAIVFLDALDSMVHWLPVVHRLYSAPGFAQDARQLLFEIWRLALEFAPAIKTCPQQVYLSALPLLPSSSKLLETSNTLRADSPVFSCRHGVVQDWPVWCNIQPSARRGTGATDIICAVFEPSGRWFAVGGSADGTVHLCPAETGNVFLSIHAHDNRYVKHLSVSSNGLRLVSTSDHQVCVVSTRSGAVLHQFNMPTADGGQFKTADFIRNDKAVLIYHTSDDDDEDDMLRIWDLETDTVTALSIPKDPDSPLDSYWKIAVSGAGRWAIVVAPLLLLDDDTGSYLGHFVDLSSGTVAYTLPFTGMTACFVSDDVAVVPLAEAQCLFNISTRGVLRKLEGETDHFHLAASPEGAMVIGMRVPDDLSNQHVINVWSSLGQRICIPTEIALQCVLLHPAGGGLVAVMESSWRMIDMEHLTAPSPPAPPISAQLGRMDDENFTLVAYTAITISHDCSLIALAQGNALRIFDRSGAVVTSMGFTMRPQENGPTWPVGLAFSHERRLVAAASAGVIYVCDLADGIVLARYEMPDELSSGLADNVRMGRFGLERVDGGKGNFNGFVFSHVAFTPDDTAVVAIMRAQNVMRPRRLALYTVQWDLRSPGRYRFSVLTTDASPWCTVHQQLAEADIDQNWNLRLSVSNSGSGGPRSAYTIPRCDWDREDDGPNIVGLEASTDQPFYLTPDGWIMESLSNRPKGWLPTSRRPTRSPFLPRMAIRGNLVATVSESGLLTILSISERS